MSRVITLAACRQMAMLLVTLALTIDVARAQFTVISPAAGNVYQADPCPFPTCSADVKVVVELTGPRADEVRLVYESDNGTGFTHRVCFLDLIEGIGGCGAPPYRFEVGATLKQGNWTMTPERKRRGRIMRGPTVAFRVDGANMTPVGPVRLSRVEPTSAPARLLLRRASGTRGALYSESGEVAIIGENLHNNPFLRVYLAPIPRFEPALAADSGLPTAEWCMHEAEIVSREQLPSGESKLTVRIPDLPETTPDKCTSPPRPEGSILTANWRWVIRDSWIRPAREHDYWAIPTPQNLPWKSAPVFKLTKPAYPMVDGFGFKNEPTDTSYREFLTVFGDSAYHCVDCVPYVGCACALPRIPDPLYHLMWFPIYKEIIDSTGGSCNGMSATSLLFAKDMLKTEDFDPDVLHPAGFRDDPAGSAYEAKYRDTSFCSPVCSPPKPDNLWATIRMNHGVQVSREFVQEMVTTMGGAIVNPDDLSEIRGISKTTFDRIKSNPQGYVACFTNTAGGHCVTPFAVSGDAVDIYDNNNPLDATTRRQIFFRNSDYYEYPERQKEPNKGNFIIANPIDIWRNDRHLLGLGDLTSEYAGELINFLHAVVVGDADMMVSSPEGKTGYTQSGAFVDDLAGAFWMSPLGPPDAPVRQSPVLLAMRGAPPEFTVNVRGTSYVHQSAAGGQFFQLEARDHTHGKTDKIALTLKEKLLTGFTFTAGESPAAVTPRVGLAVTEGQSAVFSWIGARPAAGKGFAIGGDRNKVSVTFGNSTGAAAAPAIVVNHAAGTYGRKLFGPFRVPEGATHALIMADWPDAAEAVSTIDLNSDGTIDETSPVTGIDLPAAVDLSQTADLAVSADEGVITIRNSGPDPALNSILVLSPDRATGISIKPTGPGSCAAVGDVFRCGFETINPGAAVSLAVVATAWENGGGINAAAFTSSRDSATGNDTRFLAFDDQKWPEWLRWVLLIGAVVLMLIVLGSLMKRRR